MKSNSVIIMAIMYFIPFLGCDAQNEKKEIDLSSLRGPYLGQKPPGETPEFFADGIIANKYLSFHSSLIFTPDGNECYWQCQVNKNQYTILSSKIKDGKWTPPEIAPFAIIEYRDDSPFISPDGKRFFFISRRPLNKNDQGGKENIWVMERTDQGWSEPEPLPPCINSLTGIHWQISVDQQGTLYFSTHKNESRGRRGDIYHSEFANGNYSNPVKLGNKINSADYEFSPFISPDGSYLIFSREKYGIGAYRLFISYKDKTGNWTEAINLYESNGIKGICPIVSKDAKYLFFLDYYKSHSQPFWVDAGFIKNLK